MENCTSSQQSFETLAVKSHTKFIKFFQPNLLPQERAFLKNYCLFDFIVSVTEPGLKSLQSLGYTTNINGLNRSFTLIRGQKCRSLGISGNSAPR